VAAAYKVNAVQGVLSHSLKRFVIDGDKVIINRADPEQVVEECKFETNEVYGIDIVMTSGEGKPKESEMRTTIFKRALETHYCQCTIPLTAAQHSTTPVAPHWPLLGLSRVCVLCAALRVSYSRRLLADIDERFPTFPFTLRALDEKTAKIGIADMVKHDLVHSYPVLIEKEGEFVAHVKFTAALLPSGTVRIACTYADARVRTSV
jgi:methionine aminopeptidase